MRNIKKVTWQEFLKDFDSSVHEKIAEARRREGVAGVACMVCEVLDSSRVGQRTALIYGPGCTYKSLAELNRPAGVYITGLPSSASFPYTYTEDMPS